MKQVWPDYYSAFSCIAQDCKHTCCAGWEIDLDAETLAYYQSLDGALGQRLRENIITDEDGQAQFRLSEGERCPFLNDKNLCDLIPAIGEDHLCQICTDHPRFRNFFSDRTEIGVGLCCEAAAILILSQEGTMQLCSDGEEESLTQEEWDLIMLRQRLFAAMQDRSKTVEQRWALVLAQAEAPLVENTPKRWAEILSSLERLNPEWDNRLTDLARNAQFCFTFLHERHFSIAMEQLTCYFLYRHLAGALLDGDSSGRAAFAILGAKVIGAMFEQSYQRGEGALPELAEIARQYSAEIEYSEENLCALLDILDEV